MTSNRAPAAADFRNSLSMALRSVPESFDVSRSAPCAATAAIDIPPTSSAAVIVAVIFYLIFPLPPSRGRGVYPTTSAAYQEPRHLSTDDGGKGRRHPSMDADASSHRCPGVV